MNELFIERMKELLKDDFDAFMNSLNENEVKSSIYRKTSLCRWWLLF